MVVIPFPFGLRDLARCCRVSLLTGLVLLSICRSVEAQRPVEGRGRVYHPWNQATPPGVAGSWAAAAGKAQPGVFQTLRVDLPSRGEVVVYGKTSTGATSLKTSAKFGVAVGHTYRLKISGMPELPGVELFPSIEVLDRLHPPKGQADRFPIPVRFTAEEIEWALAGRLVTKIIYLEQPQLSRLGRPNGPDHIQNVPSHRNLMAEADHLGRPMLIVRLGGRLPDILANDPGFYSRTAPLVPAQQE